MILSQQNKMKVGKEMHEKVFESLDAINKEVDKFYQNLRKECKTYKELEKVINDIVWHGSYDIEFLVEALRHKMEEEKSRLPIR